MRVSLCVIWLCTDLFLAVCMSERGQTSLLDYACVCVAGDGGRGSAVTDQQIENQ